MRRIALIVALPLVLTTIAIAVRQVVILHDPQPAKCLEGVVLDPTGAPIPFMTVNDRAEDWGTVLRSTTTDSERRFGFPSLPGKTIYHLSVEHPLFNPLWLKLKLDKHAPDRGITVKAPIGG
jgi:hypothetical protein